MRALELSLREGVADRVGLERVEIVVGLDRDLLGLALAGEKNGGGATLPRHEERGWADGGSPSLPKTRTPLSWFSATPVANWARMPAGKLRGGDGVEVDFGFGMEAGVTGEPERIGEGPPLRGAGDEAGDRGGIATDVEDAAAAELVLEKAALGVEAGLETEAGLDDADLADGAGADELDELGRLRVAAVH